MKNELISSKPTQKKCAYCSIFGVKLTKEHSISNFLAREMRKRVGEEMVIFANNSKSKLDNQNVTTSDVCFKCNNERLQILDSYGKELYEKYFSKIVQIEEKINFIYDYEKLARWIVKTIYNVERKEYGSEKFYSQFAEFCIGKAPHPANYLLFLFLLKPYFTTEQQQNEMVKHGLEPLKVIEPYGFGVKSSKMYITKSGEVIEQAKIFQINSYNFLLIPLSKSFKVRKKQKEEIKEFLFEGFKDIWLLEFGKCSIKINTSILDYVDTKVMSGYLQDDRYKKWLSEYLEKFKPTT